MPAITSRIFQVLVITLLIGILLAQLAVLRKLPLPAPTIGQLQAATTQEERQELIKNTPRVLVGGSVEVDGSVQVSNEPLEVEVTNR